MALRVAVVLLVTVAVLLPLTLSFALQEPQAAQPEWVTLVALLALAVVNVECGRIFEGGLLRENRPHKALSVWAFIAILTLPFWFVLPVVALTYAHVWWRGVRVELWRWVGSASIVTIAAVCAGVVARALHYGSLNWLASNGGPTLVAIGGAAFTFLAVETALFHLPAYLNRAGDEIWLRHMLASRSFYLTELMVLLIGGLTAGLWARAPVFTVLLVPVFVLAQQAVLSEPLRALAEIDDKTGLLRFETWKRQADLEWRRAARRGDACTVMFADLDHFKAFNDAHGHLEGDRALSVVAQALQSSVRDIDLVGRFGGEEFCALLPGAPWPQACTVAERVRCSVEATTSPQGHPMTISIGGIAASRVPEGVDFEEALAAADAALLAAKQAGRNRSEVRHFAATAPELSQPQGRRLTGLEPA
jgi:diguanylate cyclase (GGDEF)-like protein